MNAAANSVAPGSSDRIGRMMQSLARRPQIGVEALALCASVFFTASCHGAFWHAVAATGALRGAGGWLTGASLLVSITALNMVLLCALLNRWTAKPVLIALLLVTALAVHFMDRYTVYFDVDMIRNILHTDRREAGELVSFGLVPSLLLRGVLPALLVWRLRLKTPPLGTALLKRLACVGLAVAMAAGGIMMSFQNLSTLIHDHTEIRYLVTPGNYLVSLGRVLIEDTSARHRPPAPIGMDARVVGRAAASRPRLLVVVVGETVRARSWGLNGYARQTTPQLASIDPINFSDVTACGSSTEISLPCMFSMYGRGHYDKDQIEHSESLLHVLEHAGIATLWRDNQTGCKGVCEGLAFESLEHASDPGLCNSDGCLDEVMLRKLSEDVEQHAGDMVVVLHQLGSHGPSYYKRYPRRLERFIPTCQNADLGECTPAAIVNAYDNAVLYTDDFLARTIHFLAARSDRDTAMIYISDHGESLGEHGLFLHGVPYAIAPDVQLKVPMVMWFSPGMVADRGIDLRCMDRKAREPASHDNLFHSVLGLMQVRTTGYDESLDLFHDCTGTEQRRLMTRSTAGFEPRPNAPLNHRKHPRQRPM